jgi:pyruvate-ferredoxin/flavodoxin oxidoreductase
MYAQGYFAYDSKKSGGVTISHLRFGKKPIKSTYYVSKADFVACHNPSYVDKYKMVKTSSRRCVPTQLFLDSRGTQRYASGVHETLYREEQHSTLHHRRDAHCQEIGLGGRVNTILQAAFFKLTGIIKAEKIVKYMKDAATKSFSKKGEKVVAMNHAAIDQGFGGAVKVKVPADWAKAKDVLVEKSIDTDRADLKKFVKEVLGPVSLQQGDALPVVRVRTCGGRHVPAGFRSV